MSNSVDVTFTGLPGLGDALLLATFLRNLNHEHPHFNIHVMHKYKFVFRRLSYIKNVRKAKGRLIRGHPHAYRDRTDASMDIVECFHNAYSTKMMNMKLIESPILRKFGIPEISLPKFLDYNRIGSPYGVVLGGKMDSGRYKNNTRVIDPVLLQNVINHTNIKWVQVGTGKQFTLNGTDNWIDRTDVRGLFSLVKYADVVLCPQGGIATIAACYSKPTIIIGGGREDSHVHAYRNRAHVFSSIGRLNCCENKGCWSILCPNQTQRVGGYRICDCMDASLYPSQYIIDAINDIVDCNKPQSRTKQGVGYV